MRLYNPTINKIACAPKYWPIIVHLLKRHNNNIQYVVNDHDPLMVAVKTLIANTEFDPQRETLKQAKIPSSSSFTS